jgi:hypothetical protein
VGDPYDIDYVAHEIGHQFRGNHTFNAITGSCNGNRSSTAAVEPGSGVTIMGYAGICQGNNVANNSIAYFHAISYDEIVNFTHTGAGNSCPVISNTGNNAPVVSTVANHVIPKGTPFVLSGSATDVDGDKLFYSWEQTDLGTAGANWNSGSRPYFRSYVPDTIAPTDTVYSRFFPRKSVIVNGNYTGTIGEYLPQTAQTLNFRLTARDNKMGGGGVCYALNTVTIDEVGPLMITYPDANGIVWPISTSQTITWDVNATNLAPVSCDSVQISISYDSGNTFSVIIAATANDGAETITAPTLSASISTCRIRVSSIGNIFYDVSNRNFTISTTANENTVGITQVSKNNPIGLMVWPNPSSEYIRLVAGNLSASSETKVSIVDIMGKTAFEFSYSGKTEINETIALSALSKGVYFVKVHNASNQSVHRIVKN